MLGVHKDAEKDEIKNAYKDLGKPRQNSPPTQPKHYQSSKAYYLWWLGRMKVAREAFNLYSIRVFLVNSTVIALVNFGILKLISTRTLWKLLKLNFHCLYLLNSN